MTVAGKAACWKARQSYFSTRKTEFKLKVGASSYAMLVVSSKATDRVSYDIGIVGGTALKASRQTPSLSQL